jgi:hypothetical protein
MIYRHWSEYSSFSSHLFFALIPLPGEFTFVLLAIRRSPKRASRSISEFSRQQKGRNLRFISNTSLALCDAGIRNSEQRGAHLQVLRGIRAAIARCSVATWLASHLVAKLQPIITFHLALRSMADKRASHRDNRRLQ